MADRKNFKITGGPEPEKRYEYLFQARFSLPEPWKGYEQERRLDRELRKAIERFANGEEIISLLNRGLYFERAIELATGQTLAHQNEDGKWELQDAPTIIPASEDAKTEEDTEPWLCLSCRHYPPSSTDGKPCSQCNPSEVWHSCYDPVEEGE